MRMKHLAVLQRVLEAKDPGQHSVFTINHAIVHSCHYLRQYIEEATEMLGISEQEVINMITLKKIDEENLKEVIKEARNNMYKNKLLKRKSIYNFIISSLERILWEKNQQTKGHTERLKRLALQLGRAINLPQNKLDELVLLPTLHDIGKIAIPDKILMKKGKLTAEEWKIIKRHPEIGYKIAESTPQIAQIAGDILSHHEWWNGAGYPQGLGGGYITVNACITSIVDAYDVMTFGRPYREAISEEEAIEELRRCSGTQFNPMLVRKFVILLKKLN